MTVDQAEKWTNEFLGGEGDLIDENASNFSVIRKIRFQMAAVDNFLTYSKMLFKKKLEWSYREKNTLLKTKYHTEHLENGKGLCCAE